MDEKFKFEFELTAEQVKEVEEALQSHQRNYFHESLNSNAEVKKKALDKFMVMEDILNQFNLHLIKYKLG